jgi:hypothetical protein
MNPKNDEDLEEIKGFSVFTQSFVRKNNNYIILKQNQTQMLANHAYQVLLVSLYETGLASNKLIRPLLD